MQATVTSMAGVTATLGNRFNFCNSYAYTVDKVLLPAATYAATPTTYIAGVWNPTPYREHAFAAWVQAISSKS